MKARHIILPLLVLCAACREQATDNVHRFTLPEIPATMTEPGQRADFLALHYWDNFDFADTALIGLPEITEQAFADFIDLLPHSSQSGAAIDAMLREASCDSAMLRHFIELSDKYLYDPNSPMRNERIYTEVLSSLLDGGLVDGSDTLRLRYRLDLAMRNRPGQTASDFEYLGSDDKRHRMSDIEAEHTLLFFNDPGCADCRRVKRYLDSSPVVAGLLGSGRLAILAVCVEEADEGWKQSSAPSGWLNGKDKYGHLTTRRIYDLRAIPTLYLLDGRKRVILKDASVEAIEQWLSDNAMP